MHPIKLELEPIWTVENACNYIHMYHFNRQINVVIVNAQQYITPVILLILYYKPKKGPQDKTI